jgi:hypothetical protein
MLAHILVVLMELIGVFDVHVTIRIRASFEERVLNNLNAVFYVARAAADFHVVEQFLHFITEYYSRWVVAVVEGVMNAKLQGFGLLV